MKTLSQALDELGGPRYAECVPWQDWEVVALSGEADYQGSVEFIARDPRDHSRFVKYGWSYGSCSGCDGWESSGSSDAEIAEEMKAEAVFYDDASLNTLRIMMRRTQDSDRDTDWRGNPSLVVQLEDFMKGKGYAAN